MDLRRVIATLLGLPALLVVVVLVLQDNSAPVTAVASVVVSARDTSAIADLPPPEVPPDEPETTSPTVTAPAAQPARREASPVRKAASNGEHVELARLLAAGGDIADVRPASVKTLVARSDVATLRVLFEHGFDLGQRYARQTFGDQAVSGRKADVVRLIREFDGLFEAPAEFVALAAEDVAALRTALASAGEGNRWRGQTIDSYARHPDAKALLERARAP